MCGTSTFQQVYVALPRQWRSGRMVSSHSGLRGFDSDWIHFNFQALFLNVKKSLSYDIVLCKFSCLFLYLRGVIQKYVEKCCIIVVI